MPRSLKEIFDDIRSQLTQLGPAIEDSKKGEGVDLAPLNLAIDDAQRETEALIPAADPLARDDNGYPPGWNANTTGAGTEEPGPGVGVALAQPHPGFAPGNAPPELLVSPGLTAGRDQAHSATGELKPEDERSAQAITEKQERDAQAAADNGGTPPAEPAGEGEDSLSDSDILAGDALLTNKTKGGRTR